MIQQNLQYKNASRNKLSRRELLKLSAAFAASRATLQATRALGLSRDDQVRLAYAGTYNKPIDGGGGNGRGIYLFKMDSISGELTLVKLAAEARNPSWLSIDPSGRYLYAVNEISDYEGGSGSVSAYALDATSGELRLLNVVRSEGAGPAHLSVDASGKYVFVANYAGGSVAVLPIQNSGAVAPATYSHQDKDSVGSTIPSDAPAGSFAFSGHDKPHAHMIHAAPGNRFVLHTDLGQDRLYVHRFDAATGELTPANTPFASLANGDGPRHFVFHQNGKWLYSLQEEASTVVFFVFDPVTGSLRSEQTISTLPAGFRGTSFTSEIVLSIDGRFLYVGNRLHDTIGIFSIRQDGRLNYMGETSTLGDYPRHLSIEPGGNFLYACNQRSDDITSFRINRKTGQLTFTGQYTTLGSPACLIFR